MIVGPPDVPEGALVLPPDADLHVFPVTADKHGKLRFHIARLDLGLGPGPHVYRLDYVVVHDHPTVDFPGNLVLACEPASFFTI